VVGLVARSEGGSVSSLVVGSVGRVAVNSVAMSAGMSAVGSVAELEGKLVSNLVAGLVGSVAVSPVARLEGRSGSSSVFGSVAR
jgi:hypothetical protein